MYNTKKVIGNILGKPINTDLSSKNKRKCKVCGQVHKNMPFTDCYSEKNDGPLPDDLQDFYRRKVGSGDDRY